MTDPDADGNALGLEAYVASRLPGLLRYAYLLTGNPHDASDLVQSALEKTGVRWRSVVATGSPDAYVRKAILHAHVSRWRRRRRETLVEVMPERAAADERHLTGERQSPMWDALAKLPPRQRAVLVLRYYEDLSEREIAQALGISVGTVKSQASRGVQSLRASMSQQINESGVHS